MDSLKAWAESLGGITYPLLSDFYPHGQVAEAFGVLRPEGYSERALFIIDKRGVIRYVDVHDIDQQPDNEVLFEVLEELEPELAAQYQARQAAAPPPAPVVALPASDIILYCTPWCPDCKRARIFFNNNNIKYTEIDITRDRTAAARVREWNSGKEITPTFNLHGEVFTGFNEARIRSLLKI